MPEHKSNIALCMVMLKHPQLPSATELLPHLQQMLSDQFDASVTPSKESKEGVLSFDIGESHLSLVVLPIPIPSKELDSLIRMAWHWPEAKVDISQHQSHVLVAIGNAPADPIARTLLLTRVAAAVASATSSVGVYWGSGPAITSSDMFIEEGRKASRENLFPVLWVSFNLFSDGEGRAVITQGMQQFDFDELELWATDANISDALPLSVDVASYVLEKGVILEDGHTFGRSATEKFPITHRPGRFDPTKNAVVLDMRPPGKRSFIERLFGRWIFGTRIPSGD